MVFGASFRCFTVLMFRCSVMSHFVVADKILATVVINIIAVWRRPSLLVATSFFLFAILVSRHFGIADKLLVLLGICYICSLLKALITYGHLIFFL